MDLLKNIFKGDKVIWIIFLLLCIISIIEVFSASSTLVYKSGDHWGPITRHLIFLVIGGALVVFFHNIPYQWFQVFPPILLPLSAIFLILLLLFDDLNLGGILVIENVNNASRWVKLFGLQFQPSELAKMAVVIVTARILARNQGERGALPEAFKQILLIGGVMCLMIMPENYSTAVLLFATIFLMMFVGGVQLRKLLALGGGLMAVMVVFVAFLMVTPNETLREVPGGNRFETWKNRILDYARTHAWTDTEDRRPDTDNIPTRVRNGGTSGSNQATATPDPNETFTAQYNVDKNVGGTLTSGDISGKTTLKFEDLTKNDSVTVKAVAADGYEFVKWSDGNTSPTRTDKNFKQNVNVRLDLGVTKHGVGFLFNINEAF